MCLTLGSRPINMSSFCHTPQVYKSAMEVGSNAVQGVRSDPGYGAQACKVRTRLFRGSPDSYSQPRPYNEEHRIRRWRDHKQEVIQPRLN